MDIYVALAVSIAVGTFSYTASFQGKLNRQNKRMEQLEKRINQLEGEERER
ncbi:hypothetical protein [Shouchella lehensis]|uniref:hypothetical protein n=1 Tax=Shouchella lehensis TaxID=300825 RepID=UPI0014195276|nr:hypothetical protein [Shouchella lehensis]